MSEAVGIPRGVSSGVDARLSAIVNISADAIISIDVSQHITLFNIGAEKIFGYSAAEAIGQPLRILLPEGVRNQHAEHVREFAESPTDARRMGERSAISGRRKNGEIFPAEASISKAKVDGDWIFTVILRDATERQRAEATLRQAVAVRDEVVAIVSHDLRNPLSVVKMCASTLSEEPLPDAATVTDLARTVHQSAEWMQTIIQDLLDVAHLESGRLSLRKEVASIAEVIRHTVDLHAPLADERDIALSSEVGAIPSVNMDKARIEQVLANLIGNALKFTERGGSITVSARVNDERVVVSVADTGRGVNADDLSRLFDRFWQASRGDLKRGTGLGLAIAKGIVEAHDGRIWVDSVEGKGASFSFSLPLSQSAPTDQRT
jgi:PAS domain S-box-containing protein